MSGVPDGYGPNSPHGVSMVPEAVLQYLQQYASAGPLPRQALLDRYDSHWRGKQYTHQKLDWWGMNADTAETIAPLVNVPPGFEMPANAQVLSRQKRPTAPANSPKVITRKFTRLLFSRSRKPKVNIAGDPDSDAFIEAVFQKARFWNVMKMARNKAGALGSVAVTVHLRDGAFCFEVHNPKHLTVVWKDRRTWEPLGFLKQYTYNQLEATYNKDGKFTGMVEVPYLYRRIITAAHDLVYKPVRFEPGQPMPWVPDPALSVQHNLGFFPGVWIQNQPDDEDPDGAPDADGAWQTFDTIDRLNSQSNKALLQNQDPTLVLKMNPKETGGGPVQTGSDGALNVGASGDAKFLEISATGVSQSREFAKDLRRQWQELTGFVSADPDKMAGAAQSAMAIELLLQPMIEVGDDLREQFGTAIRLLVELTLRMARMFQSLRPALAGGRVGVYVFDLPPVWKEEVDPRTGQTTRVSRPQKVGPGGPVEITWGPYFEDTPQDKSVKITNAVSAYTGGGIDEETMIRAIASCFDIEATQEFIERVRADAEKRSVRTGMGFDAPFYPDVDDKTVTPPEAPPAGAAVVPK